jgi:hypothetical protein
MTDKPKPKPPASPAPSPARPFEPPPLDYDKKGLDDPSDTETRHG